MTSRCRLAGLHAYLGLSKKAHARIAAIALEKVRSAPGVVAVLTASDIPGHDDISSSGRGDEPVFAHDEVMYWGQPLFAVIAETRDQARRAAALAEVSYEDLPANIDIGAAMAAGGDLVTEPLVLSRGDAEAGLARAPHRLAGRMVIGGQEHFYLESQIALAIPGEDEDVTIHTSTQHPSEIQHIVGHALGIASNAVTVDGQAHGRRLRRQGNPGQPVRGGGGFGGQEIGPRRQDPARPR